MRKIKVIVLFMLIVLAVGILNIEKIAKGIYPYKYNSYIEMYSDKYKVDPYLVLAIIKAESNFDENAKSHRNAIGLMQLTPETAEWISIKLKMKDFSEDILYKPEINISMGSWYVNDLKKEFKNNLDLMLAAYNAGRGNVGKWLKDSNYSDDGKKLKYIPFKETDKYVKKVKVNYNIYKSLYGTEKKSKIEILKLVLKNF
ncbi:lytic transglycosylase domain-containing protein [Haloimpatiens sp. FM7315]|uniref:lytic transglycosylase domain-containing protein n=1 Tax=Haloimpatiens sp. FM7315 TaxID=3298609 RepID=UPI0035A3B619